MTINQIKCIVAGESVVITGIDGARLDGDPVASRIICPGCRRSVIVTFEEAGYIGDEFVINEHSERWLVRAHMTPSHDQSVLRHAPLQPHARYPKSTKR